MRLLLLSTLAATALIAADATGVWVGSLIVPGPEGGERSGPAHLVLKQEGTKLTGTGGPRAGEQHPIQNGVVADGNVTFEMSSEGGLMKFSLRLDGDDLAGTVTREREGRTESARLAVKRQK
jgi:hypothetical protein